MIFLEIIIGLISSIAGLMLIGYLWEKLNAEHPAPRKHTRRD